MKTRYVQPIAVLLTCASLDAGCNRPSETAKTEPPSLNVTDWTEQTELFMEYPPLVAGRSARFAVHLTRLSDFSALNAGTPGIELVPSGGGATVVLKGSGPSRPGAFRVEGVLPAAGQYRWTLTIDAPGVVDRHDLGAVTVFADEAAANADAAKQPADDPAAIVYLKEQQWTNAFATARASEHELRTSFRVPAAIEPLTGGEALVPAPASGRFAADALPSVGDSVHAGQVLGRLEPRLSTGGEDRATLLAAVEETKTAVEAARIDLDRAERLLAERAVPARRVEDARRSVTLAESRLRAAEARLAQRDETLGTGGGTASGNAFVVRAPIAGRVAEVMATLGASYVEGAALFKIIRTDRVELQAQVPPGDVRLARGVSEIELEVAGRSDLYRLTPHHMHDAGVLDPLTRALPIQFEVENPGGELLVGQTGTALLFRNDRVRMIVVPKDAVLMEAGRPYVFVQLGGERFGRRPIEIATRDGDLVGVKAGVNVGDRVVTRGAYDIQLASAAKGLPAEGHVH